MEIYHLKVRGIIIIEMEVCSTPIKIALQLAAIMLSIIISINHYSLQDSNLKIEKDKV